MELQRLHDRDVTPREAVSIQETLRWRILPMTASPRFERVAGVDVHYRPADVFLRGGHGLAHPRRFGLACHLGLLAGRPSVGVAKKKSTSGSGPRPPADASQ